MKKKKDGVTKSKTCQNWLLYFHWESAVIQAVAKTLRR